MSSNLVKFVDAKKTSVSVKKLIRKILNLENSLNELDLVSGFEILKFNNQNIHFKVIYNGSPNKFINEVRMKGIEINTQNQVWEIQ